MLPYNSLMTQLVTQTNTLYHQETRDTLIPHSVAQRNSSSGHATILSYHYQHPGPYTTTQLIFNHSVQHNSIPNIWKLAKIILILKPNKPPAESASCIPISLLCNTSKILERLVLDNITPHIPLSPSRGFRQKHSTCTLLINITQTSLHHALSSQQSL